MWIPERDENGMPIFSPTYINKQGLTSAWSSQLYTTTPNTLNIYDQPIITQLKLVGGWYEIISDPLNITAEKNDYLEFSVVDKDDVLGYFSTYGLTVGEDILELGKFVRTDYINPWACNKRQMFGGEGAFDVIPGLYFRTYYSSTGSGVVDIKVSIIVDEV